MTPDVFSRDAFAKRWGTVMSSEKDLAASRERFVEVLKLYAQKVEDTMRKLPNCNGDCVVCDYWCADLDDDGSESYKF